MTKWARNGCLNLLLLMTTLSTSPILETRLKKPFSSNRKVCFCLLKNVDEGHSGLHTVSFQLSRLLCTAYCGRASKGLFSYQLHGLSCTRALRGRYHSGKQSLHSNKQGCRVSNSDNQNYFCAKKISIDGKFSFISMLANVVYFDFTRKFKFYMNA